jgi:opacity protein-like surface antigen
MKVPVVGLFLCLLGSSSLHGQAVSTASRRFDLQVGGGFTIVNSDYYPQRFKGGAFYSTLDFTHRFGAEIDFRYAKAPTDPTYEKTYEVGGRYHREYGKFEPYAKALYGRGVFNFVFDSYNADGSLAKSTVVANLAYNMFALGGGADYHLLPYLNIRGEYEYQLWQSFPPNGLSPQVITIGVAYHFPGDLKKGNRFK